MTQPVAHARASRWFAVAVPAFVALALALHRGAQMPLWRDEYATRLYASLTPAGLADATAHVDAVLAPYYFLVHALGGVVGLDSGMRLPSSIAFTLAVALTAALALRWFGPVAAVVAGLGLATNDAVLSQAANARPYDLALLGTVLAAWCVSAAVSGSARAPWLWAAFAASAAGAVLMQPMASVIVACTAVLLCQRGLRRRWLWLVASIPWAVATGWLLLRGRAQTGQLAWIADVTPASAIPAIATAAGTGSVDAVARVAVVLALAVVAVVAVGLSRGGERVHTSFAVASVFVPTAALLTASLLIRPVLAARYVVWSSVGVALLLGIAVHLAVRAAGRHRRRWPAFTGALLATAVLAVSAGATAATLWHPPTRKDDFPGAVARIEERAAVGDLLVVVQRYEQGGVALGFALSSGDAAFAREIVDGVPDGPRDVLDVREIVQTEPLRTEPWQTDGSVAGRDRSLWIVSTWPADREDPAVLPDPIAACYRAAAASEPIPVTGTRLYRAPCPNQP